MLCPVLLKSVTYSLNHISPITNFLWFLQIPSNLQETVNKGTWQHLRVSSCPMYMHVCVYIHMHIYINASYKFIYTCKHTNRPHPNIFTSKLIFHVIYKENIKKWMVFIFTNRTHSQTHMDFFLAFFRHLHPSLRACFPSLKFREHFPLTGRAIQWSSI